ncbi:MAG: class I SAM-dependent methyltransferase [Deltaproteobacteria bacterium]|nr:class I SAM-dependent methyltransferase [Deltaproteobacteria bacterium]
MRFESLYERPPSWDVPQPQPAFVARHEAGEIRGTVLDAGCGTGENALYLAAQGRAVWGLDVALPAIGQARAKAAARGLPAGRFLLGDALRLEALGLTFDTIIDSGLVHALCDRERALYVPSLARALRPGGLYHVLCFSDEQPGDEGPRRVRRDEVRGAFAPGWRVRRIEPARFVTRIHPGGARAWCATIERAG